MQKLSARKRISGRLAAIGTVLGATITATALAGLMGGQDPRFVLTYRAPEEPSVAVSVRTPASAENMYFVDVCVNKRWERAGFFAPGMYRSGALILAERHLTDKSRAKAEPLPARADLAVPAGQRVLIGVSRNPKLTSLFNVSRCSIVAGIDTQPGHRYEAVWSESDEECMLEVLEFVADSTEGVPLKVAEISPTAGEEKACPYTGMPRFFATPAAASTPPN